MLQRSLVARSLTALFVAATFTTAAGGADWPAFRGPNGNGFSSEKNVPTEWTTDQNIKWKFPLPDEGNSSPIVVGEKVFVTCAEQQGAKCGLYCLDRKTGRELWSQIVSFDKKLPTHGTNPYCAPTPTSDGKHVVVWYGTAGLFCYDLDGKELWKRNDLGEFKHVWGYAASPILYKNLVIQNCAPGVKAYLAAFDLATGKDVWRTEEVPDGNGEKRTDGAPMGTWSTPIVIKQNGEDRIVCFQPKRVVAYQPTDGKVVWQCTLKNPKGDLAYSSPMIADGMCAVFGGYNGSSMAFKIDGSADLAENELWYKPRNPQSIGTGVIIDGHVYVPDAGPNTIRCIEMQTGKEKWTERAGDGAFWGSIVMAEGRAYVTSQNGTTTVFRPSPEKFDLVAQNKLGEHCNATPALSDGQVFIRTFKNLYCIEKK